jgi:hypothetical protein
MIVRPDTANRQRVVAVPLDEVELHLASGWCFTDDEQIYGKSERTHLLMVRSQPRENAA